jgi:hypothetical protein
MSVSQAVDGAMPGCTSPPGTSDSSRNRAQSVRPSVGMIPVAEFS